MAHGQDDKRRVVDGGVVARGKVLAWALIRSRQRRTRSDHQLEGIFRLEEQRLAYIVNPNIIHLVHKLCYGEIQLHSLFNTLAFVHPPWAQPQKSHVKSPSSHRLEKTPNILVKADGIVGVAGCCSVSESPQSPPGG